MSKLTPGAVCRPATIAATIAKSRRPGLALDQMTACAISSPATSLTGTTFPDDHGFAISATIWVRSMVSSPS
jgi:hypothetical protein